MGLSTSISSLFDFISAIVLIVTCALPLSLLAILTSALSAAWALSFATLVYTNLFLSMFWVWLHTAPRTSAKKPAPEAKPKAPATIDTAPRPKRSESAVSLGPDTAAATPRDYEGVGGWQVNPLKGSDDTQSLFLNMNSRLSVHSPTRSRRRSFASNASGFVSPEVVGTPVTIRSGKGGHARTPSGSGSLGSYFGGSMTALSSKGERSSVELRESAVASAGVEGDGGGVEGAGGGTTDKT